MEILGLLIFIAISMATLFVICFVWAARSGQWNDLETPAYRILLEDTTPTAIKENISE